MHFAYLLEPVLDSNSNAVCFTNVKASYNLVIPCIAQYMCTKYAKYAHTGITIVQYLQRWKGS